MSRLQEIVVTWYVSCTVELSALKNNTLHLTAEASLLAANYKKAKLEYTAKICLLNN